MIDNVEKFCGSFAERLPLLKNIFKGDKVIWVLFLLLNMVEVCSSPTILNHGNIMLAAMRGTMVLTLCVVMTILVVNIHYRYFKVIVPMTAIVGYILTDEITAKQFSPVVLIESVLCLSILIMTVIMSRRCGEFFPTVIAIAFALLMLMLSVLCIGDHGISLILNSLFIGIILSTSRVVVKQKSNINV